MNKHIYAVIEDVLLAQLEGNTKFQELLSKHNLAIEQVDGKVSEQVVQILENSVFASASISALVAFELGLQLGRNPESIFALPENNVKPMDNAS